MKNYIEVTNYIMHSSLDNRVFIDFENALIGNPRFFKKELYLLVKINNEDMYFQAGTEEKRNFIKEHFGIDLKI
jgi:hypothetical protein